MADKSRGAVERGARACCLVVRLVRWCVYRWLVLPKADERGGQDRWASRRLPRRADTKDTVRRRPRKYRTTPEADLIEFAKKGDTTAFDELVNRFAPSVLGYLSARIRNVADAEDITQDVFISAFRHLRTLRSTERLTPWLMTIAKNKLLDYHRKKNRTPVAGDPKGGPDAQSDQNTWNTIPDNAHNPAERAHSLLVHQMILEEIARLGRRYQEVLYPRLIEDVTTEEIAVRLGLSVSAVRTRLLRGMKKLRAHLASRGISMK